MPIVGKPSLNGHAILDEARRLQGKGYAVVPCDGKKAIVPGWNLRRLTKAELDAALMGTKRNIAIDLNQSDLIDVDCDGPEAEANLQAMFSGEVPPTPTWSSKRGLHRLFRRPQGLPEKAVVKLDGIEFRIGNGKGALSVMPPSLHPDGPRYQWLPGLSLDDVEPAELPTEVVERLQAPAVPTAEPSAEGDISEGERNNTLFKIACKAARSGLGAMAVEAALQAENAARCKPPLPNAEVATIASSACTQGSQSTQENAAEILLKVAQANSELWHTADAAYATLRRDGHREHWPIRGKGYRQWLAKAFYDAKGRVVGSQTMQDVLNVLEGKGTFDGPAYRRSLRVADHEGRIYIDLADDAWQAIEVDDSGWRIVVIGDRWVKIPPQAPGFEKVTTLATFNRFIDEALTGEGGLAKTETKTVRGLNVVGVVEKANNETLYVATEGEPYPVQAQSDTGRGALDFLEWNEPVDVQAPPPDQVVDLSKFTRK